MSLVLVSEHVVHEDLEGAALADGVVQHDGLQGEGRGGESLHQAKGEHLLHRVITLGIATPTRKAVGVR